MSTLFRRYAIGISALSVGVIALSAQSASSFAVQPTQSGILLLAQGNDTKSKSNSDPTRPANPSPGNRAPQDTPEIQRPIPTLQNPSQNTPQAGVPARCAAVADASERQKCMNTPKGQ